MQKDWLWVETKKKKKQREEKKEFYEIYRLMCDGHFARIFANFKDFSGRETSFSGVFRKHVKIPGVYRNPTFKVYNN